MKAILLSALVLAGCTALLSDEHGSGGADVPHFCVTNAKTGDTCVSGDRCMWTEDFMSGGALPATHTCFCEFDQYRCSSCPSNVQDFNASCAQGQTCDFDTFEHCSCSCDATGHWLCIGDQTKSNCNQQPVPDPPVVVDAGF